MKRNFHNFFGLFLVLTLVFSGCSSGKQTVQWFKKGRWYNGLQLMPYAGIDRKELESQYQKNSEMWDKAFKFLRETDLNALVPGKYALDGENVFVSVTEAPDKEFENTKWESHRKFVDIQYIVNGLEKIGVAPLSKASVTKAYDDKKDVANYSAKGKFYVAKPGTMYIFFPGDAHRPSIKVNDEPVKKVVIKVRYIG